MLNRMIICLLMVFSIIGVVQAEPGYLSEGLDLSLPDANDLNLDSDISQTKLLHLAAMDETAAATTQMSGGEKTNKKDEFKERWLTGAKTHKYLGLGALGLGVIAALAPKEEDGLHEYSARGATFLAGTAVATGLAYHYEDLHMSRGLKDPDNLHALLGALGTLGFALAVSDAPESGHAGKGITGLLAMGIGIKYTW